MNYPHRYAWGAAFVCSAPVLDRNGTLYWDGERAICVAKRAFAAPSQMALKRGSGVTV